MTGNSSEPLTLSAEQRRLIHEGITHTLRTLKSLRGSVALRSLAEVNACREELRIILTIIESSQGSQALPDHEGNH